jgi:hypothetical protein
VIQKQLLETEFVAWKMWPVALTFWPTFHSIHKLKQFNQLNNLETELKENVPQQN